MTINELVVDGENRTEIKDYCYQCHEDRPFYFVKPVRSVQEELLLYKCKTCDTPTVLPLEQDSPVLLLHH